MLICTTDFSNYSGIRLSLNNTSSVPTVNNRSAIVDQADYAVAPKFFEKEQNNHACNCADFAETTRLLASLFQTIAPPFSVNN